MNVVLGSSGIWIVVPWLAVFGFLLLLLFARSLLVGQLGLAPADLAVAAGGATVAMVVPWLASYIAKRRFRRGWRAGESGSTETFGTHASGVMERFDTFTDEGRRVLTLAQDEAQRFNHSYIGTEHLLLALVRVPESVAARVLANMNVELSKVQMAVEFIIGRAGGEIAREVGLTPRAKRVIELALDESRGLGHSYIGTEHLLLGIVREGEGIAAGVLESLGAQLGRVRQEVVDELKRGAG